MTGQQARPTSSIPAIRAAFRLAGPLLFALVVLPSSALASVHPLGGNARFQTGSWLPTPVSTNPAPTGKVEAVPGAVVEQTGSDPKTLRFPNGAMKVEPVPFVLPVASGVNAFQIQTAVGITYPTSPGSMNTLSAGGRMGASTVSWCPGNGPVTPTGNPACASGSAAPHPRVKGILIYTRTNAQFGGAMRGRFYGGGNRAILGSTPAPCINCLWIMAPIVTDGTGTGAVGNTFGGSHMHPGDPFVPGFIRADATSLGLLSNATPTSMSLPGFPNPLTAFGGPWTTGRVTVTAPLAFGMAEIFVLTGSDARIDGVGTISLVAGGLSNRAIEGPNANRGWLNLTIGAPLGAVPSMAERGMALLALGIVFAGARRLRKTRNAVPTSCTRR